MPCLTAKLGMAAAGVAVVASGVAAIPAAPTVIGEVAVWAAFAGSVAAYIVAALALADCLEDAGRHQDAESLRREIDEIKRQMQELEQRVSQ
jgi:membrane protein implicated in regulation of membrane protease activity